MELPKSVQLQKIQACANHIGAFDSGALAGRRIEKDIAEAILAMCRMCLANIDEGIAQGIGDCERLAVTLCGRTEPQIMTMHQLQSWCIEVGSLANERVYRSRIQQALVQAHAWVSDLKEPGGLSEEQALFAEQTGCCLLEVVRDAQSAGVPDTIALDLNGSQVQLSKVIALGRYVAQSGREPSDGIEGRCAAWILPYLQTLSGDKRILFQEESVGRSAPFTIIGSGGRPLTTPEAMQEAGAWYVWARDTTLHSRLWRIRGWRFENDRILEPYRAQGIGPQPPESAFP